MATTKSRSAAPSNPFIKQLVSSNRTERDRALSSLRTYLHRAAPIAELELLKLWEGLFYSMFMCDKPRNQQQLARDLAALVDVRPTTTEKLQCLKAFWEILARKWEKIDYLRLDKYLYLIRCMVKKGFEVCADAGWENEVWAEYEAGLKGKWGPLSARESQVPGGIRLHVLDVWVDELENVDGKREAPIRKVMGLIRGLGKESLVKSVRVRAKETVEDDRLENGVKWKEVVAEDDEQEEE